MCGELYSLLHGRVLFVHYVVNTSGSGAGYRICCVFYCQSVGDQKYYLSAVTLRRGHAIGCTSSQWASRYRSVRQTYGLSCGCVGFACLGLTREKKCVHHMALGKPSSSAVLMTEASAIRAPTISPFSNSVRIRILNYIFVKSEKWLQIYCQVDK